MSLRVKKKDSTKKQEKEILYCLVIKYDNQLRMHDMFSRKKDFILGQIIR